MIEMFHSEKDWLMFNMLFFLDLLPKLSKEGGLKGIMGVIKKQDFLREAIIGSIKYQ
jgi:hypothetical protein